MPSGSTPATSPPGWQGEAHDQLDVIRESGLMAPWRCSWIEWDWGDHPMMVNSWPVQRGGMLAYSSPKPDGKVIDFAARAFGVDPDGPRA